MRHAAIAVLMLGLASAAVAQQSGNNQTPPPASTAAQPAPSGKRLPQAKTQPELDAFNAAMAKANDPAALEKDAQDFAAKFPDSELRVIIYKAAMHGYQSANDSDKMTEMGRDVLKLDPDDPEALVGVAEVLAERTRDTDLDKQQRLDEAVKLAQHATETVDTDVAVPAGTPPEKLADYKNFYRSSAYSVIGAILFNQQKYADAEGYFRKSIDALPAQPDPVTVLRLAIALDKQNKYPDALKVANQAVELTQEGTTPGKLARQERDRLVQLTGGTTPPPAAKPPTGADSGAAPPKN